MPQTLGSYPSGQSQLRTRIVRSVGGLSATATLATATGFFKAILCTGGSHAHPPKMIRNPKKTKRMNAPRNTKSRLFTRSGGVKTHTSLSLANGKPCSHFTCGRSDARKAQFRDVTVNAYGMFVVGSADRRRSDAFGNVAMSSRPLRPLKPRTSVASGRTKRANVSAQQYEMTCD